MYDTWFLTDWPRQIVQTHIRLLLIGSSLFAITLSSICSLDKEIKLLLKVSENLTEKEKHVSTVL